MSLSTNRPRLVIRGCSRAYLSMVQGFRTRKSSSTFQTTLGSQPERFGATKSLHLERRREPVEIDGEESARNVLRAWRANQSPRLNLQLLVSTLDQNTRIIEKDGDTVTSGALLGPGDELSPPEELKFDVGLVSSSTRQRSGLVHAHANGGSASLVRILLNSWQPCSPRMCCWKPLRTLLPW